jgi:hypothetical protein
MKTKQNRFMRVLTTAISAIAAASAISPLSVIAETIPTIKVSRYETGTFVGVPLLPLASASDPRFNSWILNDSGELANVRLKDGERAKTDWAAIDPAWDAITEDEKAVEVSAVLANVAALDYSAEFIYVTAEGLAGYAMGPWHGAGGTDEGYFEFRPIGRQQASDLPDVQTLPYVKIPRKPLDVPMLGYDLWPATVKATGMGSIGIWVNGTSVYGAMDGKSYNNDTGLNNFAEPPGPEAGKGIWNENAYWAESVTFDGAQFHQDGPGPTWGTHHSHINPIGVRWQLGDHVEADLDDEEEVAQFREVPATLGHSPILGWAFDGYPIYGPYGYSDRLGPVSDDTPVQLMRSGYTLRDGSFGTRNLKWTGRDQLPYWAALVQNADPAVYLDDTEKGPPPGYWINPTSLLALTVRIGLTSGLLPRAPDLIIFTPSPEFPLGCFVEDWEYRGDLVGGGSLYTDWDLDQYNGRWCVTPEFPQGTYAYFVTLDENMNPQFPYVIGPQFMGERTGGETDEKAPGWPLGRSYFP